MLFYCAGLLAVVQPVTADTMDGVTFTVTNPNLSGSPGDKLIWNYTLTNNSAFTNPTSIGLYSGTLTKPRVMEFALRYQF